MTLSQSASVSDGWFDPFFPCIYTEVQEFGPIVKSLIGQRVQPTQTCTAIRAIEFVINLRAP